jgi:flagellar assembly protein FliH
MALVREEGAREGERRAAEEFERALVTHRESLRNSVAEFLVARDGYFRRIETEVVHLALAISRKILQRECAIDPLLLSGVVRVCLDRMREADHVTLHVAASEVDKWRSLFEGEAVTSLSVTIVDEPSFTPDQCRLESDLGVVNLGIDAQLKEVERSLLDVMAARPR